ncbi:DNA polymerase IV [Lactococcus cremoris]|nr:DNA polymerase IV [Lactococcus cremoris]
MDAFFASVEVRDNSSLKGKPVVIARNPLQTGGRGVVSTCSYEARAFGIHSAMSAKEAYDLCPQAIFISGNYEKYTKVSKQVREIFKRYTDNIEAASIDEAYLDVTENKIGAQSAIKIAKLIQHDIFVELGLTCSAGVSYNKFLAKLPVEKFHGVGKATVPKLHALGFFTGGDLQKADPVDLAEKFGIYGWELFQKANGIHNSKVKNHRERKSVGKERTYGKLLYLPDDIKAELIKISKQVSKSLKRHQLKGNIIILKLRYSDFTTLTKRKSMVENLDSPEDIAEAAQQIFEEIDYDESLGVRLLGVTISGFGVQKATLDMQ